MNEKEFKILGDLIAFKIAVEKKADQTGLSIEDILFSTTLLMSKFIRDKNLQGEFGEYSSEYSFDLAKIGDSNE